MSLSTDRQYDNESDFGIKAVSGGIVISKYLGSKMEVHIPLSIQSQPVISIGDNAFLDCKNLVSVTMPDSVAGIGEGAFSGCTNLSSINMPNSVTEISESAFAGAINLKEITIMTDKVPLTAGLNWEHYFRDSLSDLVVTFENISSIKERTFFASKKLKSVIIGNSVTSIGDSAFENCDNLTSVNILNGVTNIGRSAFEDCVSLTSVSLPNSVTNIKSYAFEGCISLVSVNIPLSVIEIDICAFRHCKNLTSVTFEGKISHRGFYKHEDTFPGNLRAKYFSISGGKGTYIRRDGSNVWKKRH